MANLPIKPWELPSATPVPNASIVGGNGAVVQKYTPAQIVDVAAPLATQQEAEDGDGNGNRMSSLRVKQAIDARGFDALINNRVPFVTLASTGGGEGANIVGFIQSGASAASRTMQDKGQDYVSISDFSGADDSAKAQAAIDARRNVIISSGENLTLGGVTLSNGASINGNGCAVSGKSGSSNIAVLSDYAPWVSNIYVSGATDLTGPIFRIDESRYARIENVTAVNGGSGFVDIGSTSPSTEAANLARISNCSGEDFTGAIFNIGSSVSEVLVSQGFWRGKLQFSFGLGKVTPGSIGWRQNTPLAPPNNYARGGHELTSVNFLDLERGIHITDAELTRFNGCAVDNIADYGLLLDGSNSLIEFGNFYCGSSRGIKISGDSRVYFNGLTTKFNGVIAPWMATDFYNGVTTFYDIEVRGTSIVTISGRWTGDKRIAVDPTAKLIIDCGVKYFGRTGSISADTTTYIYETGVTPTEADAVWRVPGPGKLVGLTVAPTAAPGAGQTFVVTARKGFADTALVATISGASDFGGDYWSPTGIQYANGDTISFKLVTSSGAASARFQIIAYYIPD